MSISVEVWLSTKCQVNFKCVAAVSNVKLTPDSLSYVQPASVEIVESGQERNCRYGSI